MTDAGQAGRHAFSASHDPVLYNLGVTEMAISEVRDHISEVVGRARYGHEPTILTHYGTPAAVVISFEEYQRLTRQRDGDEAEYQLPPEIEARIEESRRHPERLVPRPQRR